MTSLNITINNIDTPILENISISELYDITNHYKSTRFINSNIIPNIKKSINNSFCENVYRYFNKSTVKVYNKICDICREQLQVRSYKHVHQIISDVIMKDDEDYLDYFYIKYNDYDLLNYALIKYCEEYCIERFMELDFSPDLKNLACQDELKVLLGKFYFYSVIFITLTNDISNFEELSDIIDDQMNDINLTSLIIDFLPPSSYDKEDNINETDSESDTSDSDFSDEYSE